MTMKLDSENYNIESNEEIISWNTQQNPSFKKYFSEDGLLYFIALKDENDKITHMGFV